MQSQTFFHMGAAAIEDIRNTNNFLTNQASVVLHFVTKIIVMILPKVDKTLKQ